MNEPFIIPVVYQGTEHHFKARFERWGYTHRISVLIDETIVIFEPDEEGGYRALTGPDSKVSSGTISMELLRTVAETLAKLSST